MTSKALKQNDRLINLIKKHEGYRRFVYNDTVGVPTVGFGRNLKSVGISEIEAGWLLTGDIEQAYGDVSENLDYFRKLDPVRSDVIINMAFNLGISRFLKFQRMHAAMRTKDYTRAAHEMLDSTWATQVGRRATELSWMMLYGRYKSES